MSAKEYKFCEKLGPGGIKCSCCSNGKPMEAKVRNNRKYRRTTNQKVRQGQEV